MKKNGIIQVLHVDDDPRTLEITKMFLEKSGQIEVLTCLSVALAYELLTRTSVDVFISDYEMPDINGIDFLKTIRKQGCDLPFILFTGRGREELIIEAYNNGATFYLQKGGTPKSQYAEMLNKVKLAYEQYINQQKVCKLSRIFKSLRDISETLHGNDEIEVKLNRVCHMITSESGYQDMRIVLFDLSGGIRDIFHAGLEKQIHSFLPYIQAGNRTSCSRKALMGPNNPVICASDESCVTCPLYSGHKGYHTMTMRLEHAGETYGIISVTLKPENACDTDEQAMFVDFSREIAYSLHYILLKEDQNIMQTLAGTNKKLNILNTITRHDIRNELTIQLFHYENLLALSEQYPAIRKDVKALADSLNNIQEHLMFSDVYQKIGIQKPKWLSIYSIVENIRRTHNFGNIAIIHATGTLEVYTDPMFAKIIINLVENALMHGSRVTTLQIGFYELFDRGILYIEDDGMGIPDEKKNRIFERGVGKNTGLGLFYTREILGLTGMSISETGTYGNGARFEIQIPNKCYRLCKGEELSALSQSSDRGKAGSDD